MATSDPIWGAPRITGELRKLGILSPLELWPLRCGLLKPAADRALVPAVQLMVLASLGLQAAGFA